MLNPVKLKSASSYLVTGHNNPDADSVCSAIALAYLVKILTKKDAKAVCASTLNPETEYILNRFNVKKPEILEDFKNYPNSKVILVDHNELAQSGKNITEQDIAAIIDHHELNNKEIEPEYIYIEKVGATSTLIADMFFYHNIEPPKNIVNILLAGIISDTNSLKSKTTTEKDRNIVERLLKSTDIDFNELGKEIINTKTIDYKNYSAKDLIDFDKRVYKFNKNEINTGSLLISSLKDFLTNKKAELITYIEKLESNKENYSVFLIVKDLDNEKTGIIFTSNSKSLVNQTFKNENALYEDNIVIFPEIKSRKEIISKIKQNII